MTWQFWRWRKERRAIESERVQQELRTILAWDDQMAATGFRHWFSSPPPYGVTLELTRREWATIHVVDRDRVAPEANCYGLWWRLADGPLVHGTKILDLSLMAPRGSV